MVQFLRENSNCEVNRVILDSKYVGNSNRGGLGNNNPSIIYIDVHEAHRIAIANASEPNNPDQYLSEFGLAIKGQIASQENHICNR